MQFQGTDQYVATDDLKMAVNAAIALKRPLLIKGEPGTGKTLLINALLATLPKNYQAVNIHYTALRPKGLIQSICNSFGLAYGRQTMAELIFKLQTYFQSLGLPEDRIQVQGYGRRRPVADNNSPLGKDKNRRVVISLGRTQV